MFNVYNYPCFFLPVVRWWQLLYHGGQLTMRGIKNPACNIYLVLWKTDWHSSYAAVLYLSCVQSAIGDRNNRKRELRCPN